MKKMFSLAVIMILCVTASMVAFASTSYSDVNGHWGENAIERWSDYNIVQGHDGVFEPDKDMTRAEAAAVFARLLKLEDKASLASFTDVGNGEWFDDPIAKCVKAGIMKGIGNGKIDPNGTITREAFFVMFARALGIPEETELNKTMSDSAEVSDWAKGSVNALINAGYVDGISSDLIAPSMNINRASVMALLDKSIVAYVTEGGTVDVEKDGIVLIVTKDPVTVKGSADVTVVVTKDGTDVSLEGETGDVTVNVKAEDVDITNAKVGTIVNTDKDTTVNGEAITDNIGIVVRDKEQASGGGSDRTESHVHDFVTKTYATCTTDGLKTCRCGATEVIPATGHKVKNDGCANCTSKLKFELCVGEDIEAGVSMFVYDDYSVLIGVPNADVDLSKIKVDATMNDVESLNITGTHRHNASLSTSMTGSASLNGWLENAWDFGTNGNENNATVNVTIGDKSCAYKVFNSSYVEDEALICMIPTDKTAASEAWGALAENVEPGDILVDDEIYIESGAYIRNGSEKLIFNTSGALNSITDLKNAVNYTTTFTNAEEGTGIEAFLPEGCKVQFGTKSAKLKHNATITVNTTVDGALESIKDASNETETAMTQAIVELINSLMGNAQGEEVNITVSFSSPT